MEQGEFIFLQGKSCIVFSGMICLISGVVLSFSAMLGDFRLLRSNFIYVYLISSMLNTLDAIRILSGPKFTKAGLRMNGPNNFWET